MSSSLTAVGTPAAEDRVRRDLGRLVAVVREHVPGDLLTAVALIGGFGRGEGGMILRPDGSLGPFNDYDLLIVTRGPFDQAPLRAAAPALARELGVDFVDFGVISAGALPGTPATVFWYEAREGHRILHGPADVLRALPRIDPARLPLVEGTRLLVNRGLALLWAWRHLDEAIASGTPLGPEKRRFTVTAIHKAVLAVGDAALIRAGAYHISYRERARRLDSVPLPVADLGAAAFREAHAAATEFKLHPRVGDEPADRLAGWWSRVRTWHEVAFRWMEEARLGADPGPWRHYPRRMARESLLAGLRHPRRYLRERPAALLVRGCARHLLDAEHSFRARLPFLLYGAGPEGLDAGLLREGLPGAGLDPARLKDLWREATNRLLAEWHP